MTRAKIITLVLSFIVCIGAVVALVYIRQTQQNPIHTNISQEEINLEKKKEIEKKLATTTLSELAASWDPKKNIAGIGLPPRFEANGPQGYSQFLEVRLELKGTLTVYSTKRKVTPSGYLYIVNKSDGYEYVLNPITYYNEGKVKEIESYLGKEVVIVGKVYQEFVDAAASKDINYVALIESIKLDSASGK
jgi:hypothetical protein